MFALPRTSRAAATIAVMVTGCLVFASPAMAKGKAPVKLDGKVNNKGVGAATSGTTEIDLDNFYFKKTFVKAPAGSVTVELKNEGSVQHTYTIDDQNIDVDLAPGASKTVTVTVGGTEPTTFYCKFHVGQGMQGALFVKAGGTGAKTGANSGTNSGGSGGYDYGN